MAVIHAEDEADVPAANRIAKPRAINRGSLPKHLPRIEEVIEPASLICTCSGCLHCIGEDVSERLDVIPAQFRVIVTRRLSMPAVPAPTGSSKPQLRHG